MYNERVINWDVEEEEQEDTWKRDEWKIKIKQ